MELKMFINSFKIVSNYWRGTPHSYILMIEGGGGQQRFIFYTQKNPNFRIWLPKKIPTSLAHPKNPLVLSSWPKKSRCLS